MNCELIVIEALNSAFDFVTGLALPKLPRRSVNANVSVCFRNVTLLYLDNALIPPLIGLMIKLWY